MIPVRELGLPDACRLVATSVVGDSVGSSRDEETLVLFDASVTEIEGDGLYVLPIDGLLQVRELQVIEAEQVAVIGCGDRRRVERVCDRGEMKVAGKSVAILSSNLATSS